MTIVLPTRVHSTLIPHSLMILSPSCVACDVCHACLAVTAVSTLRRTGQGTVTAFVPDAFLARKRLELGHQLPCYRFPVANSMHGCVARRPIQLRRTPVAGNGQLQEIWVTFCSRV